MSGRFHAMVTVVLLAASAGGAGCAAPSQVQIRPAEHTTLKPAPVDSSLNQIAPETKTLAAQSQRDVEAILKARAAQGAGQEAASAGTPPAPKPVIWSQPEASTSGKSALAGGSRSAGAPLAHRTPPADAAAKLPEHGKSSAEVGPPAPDASTNPSLAPDRLKMLTVDLARELYASGAYSATPLRELITIAAMSMIDPERRIDPQAVPDLTDKERELLDKLQTFFADLGRNLDGKTDTEKSIVQAVAKLRDSMVKQPTLRLASTALCTRVGGFGDYTPFPHFTFLAQSEQKVILYLEINDFTSELNPKNEYVTQLAQQLTIYSDRDGIPVWKEDWQSAVDVSKNRRQDFFTVQVITLPKALSVGRYQLKVRVRDEKSQAEAETAIPFEMVADPKMAAATGR